MQLSLFFNTLAVCGLAMVVIYQGKVIKSQTVVIDAMGEALAGLLGFADKIMKDAMKEVQ